ncbi:BTB/POZ domain-containing protein At3g22104-like [Hevea brasiliensis]|uniref:BTB/POZ domain-containing protein At3g22104-like n=1 Tax=Hevea brasiliensis TaxID=3981 RepID=UPI0025EB5133|nr:BTB/POZ domain-containing protein At3g22104-like [Hevea brasiliensis]
MARFCYNNGAIEITPANIVLLNCSAYFMEMGSNSSGSTAPNLVGQTEKSLEGITYWTWSDLLMALKQCQDSFPVTNSSLVLEKVLDSLIAKLALPTVASPFRCSLDNFSSQFSFDISSTCSTRNNCSLTTRWFEDLLFLNVNLFDKMIRIMVSQKLDQATIFKFLIFYLKSKLLSAGLPEKRQITEKVISLLSLLDRSCLSCKGLFDILRIISSLKRIGKCYKLKLERLIGSQLDQATLDHLLVPSPHRKHYMYDVNLVLRLAEAYLRQGWMTLSRLTKVGSLMDAYLIEVAPDFLLKPSKFAALVSVLPDSARESSDRLFQAIDLYLEVHTRLCEEEKMRLCCALNYEKLSAETLQHLAQNSKFPSRRSLQVFISQQSKHSSSISNHMYSFKRLDEFRFCSASKPNESDREGTNEQVRPCARKHRETRNLKKHLQQMQCRVAELEKVCKAMQSQMPNVTKKRLCNSGKVRSLPKLCS